MFFVGWGGVRSLSFCEFVAGWMSLSDALCGGGLVLVFLFLCLGFVSDLGFVVWFVFWIVDFWVLRCFCFIAGWFGLVWLFRVLTGFG